MEGDSPAAKYNRILEMERLDVNIDEQDTKLDSTCATSSQAQNRVDESLQWYSNQPCSSKHTTKPQENLTGCTTTGKFSCL